MNKTELIKKIAVDADISTASASKALKALTEQITQSLSKEEPVQLIGFGTFKVTHRAARMGRNPQTGEKMQIKEAKIPTFKPGQLLKERIQNN